MTLTMGWDKGGGFILYFFYAHQNTQHVGSEIIEPKQQHHHVIQSSKMHFWEYSAV